MLRKVFKTIFIISLCVGISLPTNAAVSVSDGSAFVTKAEFAADLNNLSNRMAQLENSLDAKIDSLVSSYLSRNGIWNGQKQDIAKSRTSNTGYKNQSGDRYLIVEYWNSSITDNPTNGRYVKQWSNSAIESVSVSETSPDVIIASINKTGLMCLQYDLKVSQVRPRVAPKSAPYDDTSRAYKFNLYAYWLLTLNFASNGEIMSQEIQKTEAAGNANTLLYVGGTGISKYFFVQKGVPLLFYSSAEQGGQAARYGFWDPSSGSIYTYLYIDNIKATVY